VSDASTIASALRPSRPWRVAYLVTHPIQYQAPLLRYLNADPDIELTAFFESDFSVDHHYDVEFNREIAWDVPLLGGYRHVFLERHAWPKPPPESFAFWAPMNRGLPDLLKAGRFDALWIHGYSRAHHLLAIAAARRLGIKVLLRDEMADAGRARSALRSRLKRGLFAALDKGIDAYLTIGTRNEEHCRSLGLDRRRMFRVGYTVDNAWFSARIAEATPARETLRRTLGLEPGRPIILYAAKLIGRKAPLDLVNAFAKLQNTEPSGKPYLLMAGDGDLREALQAHIDRLGLGSARLLGFQTQQQLAALYELCDVFVLPSEREAWGLVVNEVMNAGRSVIASDRVGAAADLIHDGANGAVYAYGDVAALAGQLAECLADPGRLARLGRESRRIIDTWDFEQNRIGLSTALGATVGRHLATP
jgi:glycosyltransferase involved in cell wall biosynthesis